MLLCSLVTLNLAVVHWLLPPMVVAVVAILSSAALLVDPGAKVCVGLPECL
jgi:hypothetical protein